MEIKLVNGEIHIIETTIINREWVSYLLDDGTMCGGKFRVDTEVEATKENVDHILQELLKSDFSNLNDPDYEFEEVICDNIQKIVDEMEEEDDVEKET